jgi:drug/metabolite transporter (DMT)-like permease
VTKCALLAMLAYAAFSWGDASVKALSGQLSIFEIGFFGGLFAVAFMLPSRPKDERWRSFWRMRRPWMVQARALTGLSAGVLGTLAFTTIPLAEAYALIFLSPLFVTVLSRLLLNEQVPISKWSAVAAGFAGVLLVVRPGFRELGPGHLAAVGVALAMAGSVLILRKIAGEEKRTSIFGVMMCYGLAFNGAALVSTGGGFPDAGQLVSLLLAGGFAAAGQILLLLATRSAPASSVAPAHYTQIAWATLIGAVAFGEHPDALALLGLATIAGAGLLSVKPAPRLAR